MLSLELIDLFMGNNVYLELVTFSWTNMLSLLLVTFSLKIVFIWNCLLKFMDIRGLSQKVIDFLCYKKTIQCIPIKFYL